MRKLTLSLTITALAFGASACGPGEDKLIRSDERWSVYQSNLVVDNISGQKWSRDVAASALLLSDAAEYCKRLTTGNLVGWRLPTLNELRSLIVGCDATTLGGSCTIQDIVSEGCEGCKGDCFLDDIWEIDCAAPDSVFPLSTYWSSDRFVVDFNSASIYGGYGSNCTDLATDNCSSLSVSKALCTLQ